MDIPPEAVELGVRLAESLARNTATAIDDKVRALLTARKNDQIVAGLEEIISDLVADKSELTRIAQAYQEELIAQRLTDQDVRYITDTIMPMLRKLAQNSGEGGEGQLAQIDAFAPLLSVDTVKVLQILGFNFRQALGEPLTELTRKAILSRVPATSDTQLEGVRREQAYVHLAMDAEAYARFREMFPLS
ncbi:hypothetical protein QN345_13210 [Cryobacterium sp. 10I1]|uniref:hypothetical protein n=1 Tax=Cryobacterium sp. 10I1 TaxID=3048578 RepID=UPI002B22A251|nr:hypothetical protein [Cryobacterium sp. 10I1]MEB0306262.1 hypothetical protein [Cryobacterium sp. 10I1]